jgi:hypothetical protein
MAAMHELAGLKGYKSRFENYVVAIENSEA